MYYYSTAQYWYSGHFYTVSHSSQRYKSKKMHLQVFLRWQSRAAQLLYGIARLPSPAVLGGREFFKNGWFALKIS